MSSKRDPFDSELSKMLTIFAQAKSCWASTTRPDGRTHLAPIWHVWYEGCIYLVTTSASTRVQNLQKNDRISLSLPDTENVVIVEGTVRPAAEYREELQPIFKAKYDWNISLNDKYNLILEVLPDIVLAWGNHGEGRWEF